MEGKGLVVISGQVLSARSEHGVAIPAGTQVRVLRIEGVKLIVTPACVTAGAKE